MGKLKKFPVIKEIKTLLPAGKFSHENFPAELFNTKHYMTFSEKYNKWVGKISIELKSKEDRSVALALHLLEDFNNVPESILLTSYSRGPTTFIENAHKNFLETNRVSPKTSPNTTMATLSNRIAEKLNIKKLPSFTLSATCVSGTMAIITALPMMNYYDSPALIVSSEAPITPFTIEQIKALRIYSNAPRDAKFPSQPLTFRQNTFVLSEGTAILLLENKEKPEKGDIIISRIGYFRETYGTITSITQNAFEQAMRKATDKKPDIVITHAPGTKVGDLTEVKAIQNVFGKVPITNLKWKIGHNYATSGLSNLFLGVAMLRFNEFLQIPYLSSPTPTGEIKSVLVNSAGFGGHCISVLLEKY